MGVGDGVWRWGGVFLWWRGCTGSYFVSKKTYMNRLKCCLLRNKIRNCHGLSLLAKFVGNFLGWLGVCLTSG